MSSLYGSSSHPLTYSGLPPHTGKSRTSPIIPSHLSSSSSSSRQQLPSSTVPTEAELTPADLEDEELEAYADECARQAVLADFEDIPEEELFGWSNSDLEEEPCVTASKGTMASHRSGMGDADMDTTA